MADDDRLRLRIDLAYDGAAFHGFARQTGVQTVQGALEDALSAVLGQPALTTCAGRTDRGVHASAQVVHLDVDPRTTAAPSVLADLDRLRRRLQRMTGPAMAVWLVRRVSLDFDARFSVLHRRYRYRIVEASSLHPLRRFDVWHLAEPLSVPAMRAAARHLLGEHDFASFCRVSPGRTTIRRVDEITIARKPGGSLDVRVRGPAFCQQQVRSIVGVLAEIGLRRQSPGWAAEVLAARDRSVAARVAPPQGLVLDRVSYGRRFPAAPPPLVALDV
ncbi:MAG: tRNA pseudouridine(38-40) synthase TruA [Actinomycetota bacterium]|nr:tRNA pseudouridine(38-40) synthase TruA [Actinomycetota bacterium]